MNHEIKIPKQIKVCGLKSLIRMGKSTNEGLRKAQYYGRFYGTEKGRYIELDSAQRACELSGTFIHECLEFINASLLGSELKHRHIQGITNGFHHILEQLGVRFVK